MAEEKIARPKVILDGKQAEEELKRLTDYAEKWRDAMIAAASAGDSKAEKKAAAEYKAATKEVNNLKREALSVESVLKNINGASFNEISRATKKAIADLKNMQQTDPGYEQQVKTVQQLKEKQAELASQTGSNISVWEKLKNTASGLLPAFGFTAIAGGAAFLFSKIVSGTDAMADKWEFTMTGMQNGLDYFYRTLSSGDWSNFLANLREAVKVGAEYAKMLDHAEDSTRALSMVESDARREELQLELAIKNKTLSKEDRLKAGQDRIKLEEDLSAKRTKIAQEQLDAELLIASQRTGLSRDELIAITKDIDSQSKLEADAYNEKVSRLKDLKAMNVTPISSSSIGGTQFAQLPDTPEMTSLKKEIDSTPDSIKRYAGALNQYGNLTVDIMDKISQAYSKKNEEENSAIENTKKVRTMVNSLLAGQEEDGTKIDDAAVKKRIDMLESTNNKEISVINRHHLDIKSSEIQYKSELLAQELKFLNEKLNVYKEGSKDYNDTLKEISNVELEQDKLSKDILLQSLEKQTKDKKTALLQQYNDQLTNNSAQKITEEQFNSQMSLLDIAFLESKKEILIQAGEDVTDIESEIAQKRQVIILNNSKETISKLKDDFESLKNFGIIA